MPHLRDIVHAKGQVWYHFVPSSQDELLFSYAIIVYNTIKMQTCICRQMSLCSVSPTAFLDGDVYFITCLSILSILLCLSEFSSKEEYFYLSQEVIPNIPKFTKALIKELLMQDTRDARI